MNENRTKPNEGTIVKTAIHTLCALSPQKRFPSGTENYAMAL
jgi:hypothetical protein